MAKESDAILLKYLDSLPDVTDAERQRLLSLVASDSRVEFDVQELDRLLDLAAVRGYFNLSELGISVEQESHRAIANALTRQCTTDTIGGVRKWILTSDTRRRRLKGLLADRSALDSCLRQIPASDEMGQWLRRMLDGWNEDLEPLSQSELEAVHRVSEWIHGIVGRSLNPKDILRKLAYRQLIEPFRALISKGFFGREKELARLRSYVGVLPPESLMERGNRLFSRVFKSNALKPFSIWGVGGAGKSTLVAKFLYDHATAAYVHRFPFAYLDFDRSPLVPSEPLSVLTEVVRQLELQFPEHEASFQALLSDIRSDSLGEVQEAETTGDDSSGVYVGSNRLSDTSLLFLVGKLLGMLGPLGSDEKPLVIVMDTFEEVQQRGERDIAGIRKLISLFLEAHRHTAAHLPVRIVIAGRASVREDLSPDDELEVGDLDPRSAREMLGFLCPELRAGDAAKVIQHIGTYPLSLRLAANLIQTESLDSVLDLNTGSILDRFLHRLDGERVTALLYRRTLNHISDPELARFAYPGLILRKITPTIIREVLAPAFGRHVQDDEAAHALFERFAKQVSLVVRSGSVLYHRQDVRTLTLDLMRQDAKASKEDWWTDINRRAIAFYETEGRSAKDRAEGFYHRLLLGRYSFRSLDRTWHSEFGGILKSVIAELPAQSQVYLKTKLGLSLTQEEMASLPDEIWIPYVKQKIVQVMRLGSPDRIRTLLDDRPKLVAGDSRLSYFMGAALNGTGDYRRSFDFLNQSLSGIHSEESFFERSKAKRRAGRLFTATVLAECGEVAMKLGQDSIAGEAFRDALAAAEEAADRNLILVAASGMARTGFAHPKLNPYWNERGINLAEMMSHFVLDNRTSRKLRPRALRDAMISIPVDLRGFLAEYFRAQPITSVNPEEFDLLSKLVDAEPIRGEFRTCLRSMSERFRESPIHRKMGPLGSANDLTVWKFVQAFDKAMKEFTDEALGLLLGFTLIRQPDWRSPLFYSIIECLEQRTRLLLMEEVNALLFSQGRAMDTRELVPMARPSGDLRSKISELDNLGLLPRVFQMLRQMRRDLMAVDESAYHRLMTLVDAYERWASYCTAALRSKGVKMQRLPRA